MCLCVRTVPAYALGVVNAHGQLLSAIPFSPSVLIILNIRSLTIFNTLHLMHVVCFVSNKQHLAVYQTFSIMCLGVVTCVEVSKLASVGKERIKSAVGQLEDKQINNSSSSAQLSGGFFKSHPFI